MAKGDGEHDVRVVEVEAAYQGFFRIDRYRIQHKVFHEERWSSELDREVFERGHAVGVLPYDPQRDEVVLIEQFRVGGFAAPDVSHWQIECVAGIIDAGDTPEETAVRELEEETGLISKDLMKLFHYLVSPGGTSETVHLYCSRVDATDAGGILGLEEEGEYIRVNALPVDDAFAMLDRGEIENALTIIALQWLRTNRDELRQKWSAG